MMKKRKFLYLLLLILTLHVTLSAQSWTASPPADEGTFYLYNVGRESFLYGHNDWETRASLTKEGGIPVTLIGDGAYYISTAPTYDNFFLGSDSYVDKPNTSSKYAQWTFTPVSGMENTYTMRNSVDNKYIVAHASDVTKTSLVDAAPTTSMGYWKLVTRENLIASMANADADHPVDATWAFQNPYVGRNTVVYWHGSPALNGVNNNFCFEKYNTTYDVYQEIEGMPNGVYTMKCQGFYRMGGRTNAANNCNAGTEALNAKYYINEAEGSLKSIFSYSRSGSYNSAYNENNVYTINGTDYYIPNTQAQAANCCLAGEYWNEPIRVVVTDGKLRIGVKKSEAVTSDWTIFDNFVVTYYGIDMSEMIDHAISAWKGKYEAIAQQAVDHSAYDAVMVPETINDYCTSEEKIAEYENIVWQAVSDMLKDEDNAGVLFDITSILQNPTFDSGVEGWTSVRTPGHDATVGVAEFYNKEGEASISQTLAGMPAGSYTLKAQAFYRSTSYRHASDQYERGTDNVTAYLYANDAQKAVKNINDDALTHYNTARSTDDIAGANKRTIPNNLVGADAAFDQQLYWNVLQTSLSADGDIELGLKIVDGLASNWMSFDNFRLYYGNTIPDITLDTATPLTLTEDTYANVTTNISLQSGQLNKICLPFDLDKNQTSSLFSAVYQLAGVTSDGTSLTGTLIPVYEMKAGHGYFVEVTSSTTLSFNDPLLVRAVPAEQEDVIWEGASVKGSYEGYTCSIELSEELPSVTLSLQKIDFSNDVNFSINMENWCVRKFLSEVTYDENTESVSSNYRINPIERLDQPHSVFIPVPQNNSEITVTVSVNDNYSDAETFTFAAGTTLCEIPNLIPQNTYYYKVEGGGSQLVKGQFQLDGRIRMIKANTGSNIRDMGGWETIDGNRLNYGKIYRGGEMNYGHVLNDIDIAELRRLGIGAEVDLRDDADCGETPTASILGNDVDYFYANQTYNENNYATDKEMYKNIFNFTLEKLREGTSVYFHCRIGADRTGAYGLLIGGLCGMTFDQLCKDFELTSFSAAGHRAWNLPGLNLLGKLEYINSLPGATLQQRFFYYMNAELGIEADYLYEFIDIMVGGDKSLQNSDLVFGNTQDEYLQSMDEIAAFCADGSILSDKKAQLSDGTTTIDVPMNINGIIIKFEGTLEPGKDYTLTIPVGAILKDGVENAELPLSFHTPCVFDGEYYLYMPEQKKFLSRGYSWGTRAIPDDYGIPAEFTTTRQNITKIKFLDNNLYLGSDAYADKAADFDNITWSLIPSDVNFLLQNTNGLFASLSNDENPIRIRVAEDTTPLPFTVKTKDEQKAIVASDHEANILSAAAAAGITASSFEELQSILSESFTALPSTAEIKSANAGSTSDWVLSEPDARNENGNAYNVGNYGGELYLKNASVSQTVTVPHPGLYKLTLSALFRQGTNENCYALGEKGYVLSNAYVSINDTYKTQIPDWYSGHLSATSPNTTGEATSQVNAGYYSMEVWAYIGDDKQATITVTVPGFTPFHWCMFNNFALTEYAQNITLDEMSETAPQESKFVNLTFKRSIVSKDNVESGNAWNTICFPFSLTRAQIEAAFGSNTVVKELKSASIVGDNANLNFVEVDDIEANKPYIMQTEQAGTEYLLQGVYLSPSENLTQTVDGIQFVGNYVYPHVMANKGGQDFYILNDLFKSSKGGTKIKGYRAYFHLPEATGIKSLGAEFDETTGINDIFAPSDIRQSDFVYDLTGRRISDPTSLPKGVYIINGRKVYVK